MALSRRLVRLVLFVLVVVPLASCIGTSDEATETAVAQSAAEAPTTATVAATTTTASVAATTSEATATTTTVAAMMSDAELFCSSLDTVMPDETRDRFFKGFAEVRGGESAGLVITYVDAVGRDGQWVFIAEFGERREPGLYVVPFGESSYGQYAQLWDGKTAVSAEAIVADIEDDFPDYDLAELAGCLDLNLLVDE